MALLMTASGSVVRRQSWLPFLQSIAKQRIPPEKLQKVITGVAAGVILAQQNIDQISVESDYFYG